MQTHLTKYIFIVTLLLVGGVFYFAHAASIFDITFPIPELGNCADRLACKAYCDDSANMDACIKFAQNHGLVIRHETQPTKPSPSNNPTLQKLEEAIKNGGPGGCTTVNDCKTYCSDSANSQECHTFAVEHDILPKAPDNNSDKITQLIKTGQSLPGNCKSLPECAKYCSDPVNKEECAAFALRAGLTGPKPQGSGVPPVPPGQNTTNSTNSNFVGPGGCTTADTCRKYCSDPVNKAECQSFETKLMRPPGSSIQPKPMPPQTSDFKGPGPGGCTTADACKTYCSKPENMDECHKFALERARINQSLTKPSMSPLPNGRLEGQFPGQSRGLETNEPQPQFSPKPTPKPESMATPRNELFGAVIKFFLGFR